MHINNYTYSHKLSSKPKNGDAVSSFDIQDLGLSVFLLADGVGGCVGDYKASDTAVEQFELRFRETCAERSRRGVTKKEKWDDTMTISEIIAECIEQTNEDILSETGYYQGMKTTFIVAVVDQKNEQLHYTSIGDSRLYRIDEKTVEQLSKDELKAVIRRKQDGTPITQGGAIVNGIGVTNVLGAKPLQYNVETLSINKSSSFLLASDGFYDKMNDENVCLPKIHRTLYFENQLRHLLEDVQRQQDDDASAVFFRVIKDDDDQLWVAQNQIFKDLINAIDAKDEKKALNIVTNIAFSNYDNSFEFYDAAIKRMRILEFNSSALYSELVGLLRESRKSY